MAETSPNTAALVAEAFRNARRVALPTLPGLLLFAGGMAGWAYFNQMSARMGAFGSISEQALWLGVSLVTIFVGCFWSADMYRKLLPEAGTRSLFGDAGRLFVANLAVYGLYFILLFLLTLFFSILAGVLIGSTGYDPSGAGTSPESVRASISALSGSGGAAVLYVLLFIAAAALIWLGLRLFLFGAATIAERKTTIFRSWPWTSRRVSRIALLWIFLQLLPWLVLSLIFSSVVYYGASDGGGATVPWMSPLLMGAAVLLAAPFYWLGHGLSVAFYEHLAPNRVDADATFG